MANKHQSFNFLESLQEFTKIDISLILENVHKRLLQPNRDFTYDWYKQNASALNTLSELLSTSQDVNVDRTQADQLITDICIPFLRSFAPSYDGRTEVSGAVLKVCDLTVTLLKFGSENGVQNIFQLCLLTLDSFNEALDQHIFSIDGLGEKQRKISERSDGLDILTALELLCTTLSNVSKHVIKCQSLLNNIFSASLSVMFHLEEKAFNRFVSFVILQLIQLDEGNQEKYLQEVWKVVNKAVRGWKEKDVKPSGDAVNRLLTIITSLANLFFPLSDCGIIPDVRKEENFWSLVQVL